MEGSPFALFPRTRLRQTVSLFAYRFGDISVLRDIKQVFCSYAWQDIDDRRNGTARVPREVMNDRIRSGPTSVEGYETEHFLRNCPHSGDVFDLVFGDAWVLYHGGTY